MRSRSGFTFIELIAATAAASVLMASLLGTMMIATTLLHPSQEADLRTRDHSIMDRVAADLRYATTIDSSASLGFDVTRTGVTSGVAESISYEAYLSGLTRQVDGGDGIVLDPQSPAHQFNIDGYSGATAAAVPVHARIRGVSTAASPVAVSRLDIAVPAAAKPGDLLLLITTYRSAPFVLMSPGGWNFVSYVFQGEMVMDARYAYCNASTPAEITAQFFFDTGEIGMILLAIENADPYSPIAGPVYAVGHAVVGDPLSYPQAIQSGSVNENELGLQIVSAAGVPFAPSTLGVAGFADVARRSIAMGTAKEFSIGMVGRSGSKPASVTPRFWFQQSAPWAELGIRIRGSYANP